MQRTPSSRSFDTSVLGWIPIYSETLDSLQSRILQMFVVVQMRDRRRSRPLAVSRFCAILKQGLLALTLSRVRNDDLCWLLVVSVSQNWPVRTSHHVSCSLPIPQRKSTMAGIHLPIFIKGEHLLCTGFSPSSRAGCACVFGRSTTASSPGQNLTPPRCCLRR